MSSDFSYLKTELLRRKRMRERERLPRRDFVTPSDFTLENDHNPLVQADCPLCRGYGKICEEVCGAYELSECEACDGTGVAADRAGEPFFSNDSPTQDAIVDAGGWLTCPSCGKRFTIQNPSSWTGLRHRTCGQRIRLCH